MRENFWGCRNDRILSRSKRIKKYQDIIDKAFKDGEFTYKIGDKVVCENAYLRAVG